MTKESVLVIGSGGREHALAWALSQSPHVGRIFCAPGNGGTDALAQNIDLKVSDHSEVAQFIEKNRIKLTVIGPEAPLVDGLSDALRAKGHFVLGASQKAAQLEGSKVFAKKFMSRHGIPTAAFRIFTTAAEAKAFAQSAQGEKFKIVKADGLAAGKGVFVCKNTAEVLEAITATMEDKKFGGAGNQIILEETLSGPEISIIALTDGKTVLPFPASQDHKRAFDGDEGPNTGGMGAYAPTPFYDDHTKMQVEKTVIDNFLRGLETDGLDFRGIIYFGLMLTPAGPQVLEFNVRFGDPEAQTILPLVESDLFEAFVAVAEGKLADIRLQKKHGSACTVVLASGGYPGDYKSGYSISGLDDAGRKGRVFVFHAGTKKNGDDVVTAGGRVLNVTAIGKTLDVAVVRAYQGVKKISFKDVYFRNDIAAKAFRSKTIKTKIQRMKRRHAKESSLI